MILKIFSITMPANMTRKQDPKKSIHSTSRPKPKGIGIKGKARRGHHRVSDETFTFTEADDRIYDFFRTHGFEDYPHEKRHQLVKFYLMLMKEQSSQNITRLLTIRDVSIKHFVDCLMVPRLTKLKFPLLDIGTGAGFPGIPLKIDSPDAPILLSEGVQKRVEFLKTVRDQMALKNLDIIGRNINDTFVYPINGAITRAVEGMEHTLQSVINALQLGGEVYFMKGPNLGTEINDALEKWGNYYELKATLPYTLPNTPHERHLVIFRKHTHPKPVSLNKLVETDDEN